MEVVIKIVCVFASPRVQRGTEGKGFPDGGHYRHLIDSEVECICFVCSVHMVVLELIVDRLETQNRDCSLSVKHTQSIN